MSDVRRRLLASMLIGAGDPKLFKLTDWATAGQRRLHAKLLRIGVGQNLEDYRTEDPDDEVDRCMTHEFAITDQQFGFLLAELREEQARSEVHQSCADIVTHLGSGGLVSGLNGMLERMNKAVHGSDAIQCVEEIGDHLDELFISPKPGVPLGLECLERLVIRRGDFAVFAARPGCGKTAMLGTLSLAAAQAGWRVLFFSLEMSAISIRRRLASALSGIPLSAVQDPQNSELARHLDSLKLLPITISDGRRSRHDGRITLESIKSTTRAIIDKLKPENMLVVVDYLQLVQTSARYERRHELLGHVCRELKDLSMSEDVPVVVAAQLGRGVEQRGKDARPNLSDLRESGEIENTADQVVLMHREPASTVLSVAKYRNGPSFTAEARFDGDHTRFTDFGGWS